MYFYCTLYFSVDSAQQTRVAPTRESAKFDTHAASALVCVVSTLHIVVCCQIQLYCRIEGLKQSLSTTSSTRKNGFKSESTYHTLGRWLEWCQTGTVQVRRIDYNNNETPILFETKRYGSSPLLYYVQCHTQYLYDPSLHPRNNECVMPWIWNFSSQFFIVCSLLLLFTIMIRLSTSSRKCWMEEWRQASLQGTSILEFIRELFLLSSWSWCE